MLILFYFSAGLTVDPAYLAECIFAFKWPCVVLLEKNVRHPTMKTLATTNIQLENATIHKEEINAKGSPAKYRLHILHSAWKKLSLIK